MGQIPWSAELRGAWRAVILDFRPALEDNLGSHGNALVAYIEGNGCHPWLGSDLERDDFNGEKLRGDDVSHAADCTHAHLFQQSEVVEASFADDQADALRLERLQNVEDGRALNHHSHAGSVKADRSRQSFILLQEEQVLAQQKVLQFRFGGAHAVMDDLNEQ